RATGEPPTRAGRDPRNRARPSGFGRHARDRQARREPAASLGAAAAGARIPTEVTAMNAIHSPGGVDLTFATQLAASQQSECQIQNSTRKPVIASRRELLRGSGVLFAWACLPKIARAEGRDPRLLVIVLRGALDGLATVAPVGDPDW